MKAVVTGVALVLLLTGCAQSSPEAELQEKANALVEAANSGDASGVRTAAGLLLQEVQSQDANADISAAKARNLVIFINRILANAGLLEQTEEPSKPPAPVPSTVAPTPTPTPTPSAEPTPEPEPEPEEEESSPPPPIVPSIVGGSPSPSQS